MPAILAPSKSTFWAPGSVEDFPIAHPAIKFRVGLIDRRSVAWYLSADRSFGRRQLSELAADGYDFADFWHREVVVVWLPLDL